MPHAQWRALNLGLKQLCISRSASELQVSALSERVFLLQLIAALRIIFKRKMIIILKQGSAMSAALA
jgi:hypothetical protein